MTLPADPPATVPAGTPGSVDNPFGTYLPAEVERSYTDFLPAVNVWFDPLFMVTLR